MFTVTENPVLDRSEEELYSVVPERLAKNDPPSENRVWNFSAVTTASTENFSVQVYEAAPVETGCSYDTASGRSILFFVDPYGLCSTSSDSQIGLSGETYWEQGYGQGYESARYQSNQSLTLGASFSPDSYLGDVMAQDNALSYIMAPSSAVLADDVARVAGNAFRAIRVSQPQTSLADDFLSFSDDLLGEGAVIRRGPSNGSDFILKSADDAIQIRIDYSNPHGIEPHINLEMFKPKYPGSLRMDQIMNQHVFPKGG